MLRTEDKERLEGAFVDLNEVTTPDYSAFKITDFQTVYATWSEILEVDEHGVACIPVNDAVKMMVEARRAIVSNRKYDLVADAIEGAAIEMAIYLPIKIDEQSMDRML